MAIGAYALGLSVDRSTAPACCRRLGGANAFSAALVFAWRCSPGGLAAALAGLIVGVPSLRLKGDYLAIVTLGFGEIIRV